MITEEDIPYFKTCGVYLIHINCDPSYAENRDLPRDALLVHCIRDNNSWFDIVTGSSRASIFDAYYDRYGDVLQSFSWTKGTINPKFYNEQCKPKTKKREK